jgi:hypothetical protein
VHAAIGVPVGDPSAFARVYGYGHPAVSAQAIPEAVLSFPTRFS